MKRRSPIRHTVRSHVREAKPVVSYVRGSGQRMMLRTKPAAVLHVGDLTEGVYCDHEDRIKPQHCGNCSDKESFSESHEARQYTVNFTYEDGSKETVKAVAHSPKEALHFADQLRTRKSERPVEVNAKNLLGEIVGKIGAWTVGGIKKAAYTYKATRAAAKEKEEALKEKTAYRKEQAEVAKEERLEELRLLAKQGDKAAQRTLERLEAKRPTLLDRLRG